MKCNDCNGSGADALKTAEAIRTGRITPPAYIRCWTCNGNGLEPQYPYENENRYYSRSTLQRLR